MDQIKSQWIKEDQQQVHLRLLLFVVFRDQHAKASIRETTLGIWNADIVRLANYLLSSNGPLYGSFYDLCRRMRPWILAHYPHLNRVDTEKLSNGNYNIWLLEQIKLFGVWLKLEPMVISSDGDEVVRPTIH